MKGKKIIKNYIYNGTYQLLLIITPIITTPYISRILGAEGIGIYSSTYGISKLFYIIGMLGIMNYGAREIAYCREDKDRLNKVFWEVWILQLVVGVISSVFYSIIFIKNNAIGYSDIFLIQLPVVLGAIFDITWLYVGVEDFKKTVSRNIIVKIIGIIAIFTFVKDSNDVGKYVAINSLSTFLGIMTLWMFVKEYIKKIDLSTIKISRHLKGALIMLIPQLAVHFYTGLDRTMVNSLSSVTEAGFYDQAQKIARIALSLVTSLSVVLMPSIANLFANKDEKSIQKYLKISLNFTLLTSCLVSAGIVAVSKHFVPIFFGDEFRVIIPYMMITSLIVILIPIGGVFANQYALPTGKNKEYTIPLVACALINIVLNIIFVPSYGALGAVISIVLTEFVATMLRVFLVKQYLKLRDLFTGTIVYIVAGIISCIITLIISNFLSLSILSIIIEVIVCTSIYSIIVIVFSNFIRGYVKNWIDIIKIKKFNS